MVSPRQAKNFSDDKLVRLLCRAVKATFNPAQDECHIQLAPIPEVQAVAIKGITIQSELRGGGAEAYRGWA